MKIRESSPTQYFLNIYIDGYENDCVYKDFIYYITGCIDDFHACSYEPTLKCEIPDNIIDEIKEEYLMNCFQFDVDGYNEDGYTFYHVVDFWENSKKHVSVSLDFVKPLEGEVEKQIIEKIKYYFSHINTKYKNYELKLYEEKPCPLKIIKDYLEC